MSQYNTPKQHEWHHWFSREISDRLWDFKMNPTDGNKDLLLHAVTNYQQGAALGKFIPSESYQRPGIPG